MLMWLFKINNHGSGKARAVKICRTIPNEWHIFIASSAVAFWFLTFWVLCFLADCTALRATNSVGGPGESAKSKFYRCQLFWYGDSFISNTGVSLTCAMAQSSYTCKLRIKVLRCAIMARLFMLACIDKYFKRWKLPWNMNYNYLFWCLLFSYSLALRYIYMDMYIHA